MLASRARSTNYSGELDAAEVARKYIVTENFEKWAGQGGATYTDRSGNVIEVSKVWLAGSLS